MAHLVLFETSGNQRFIFATNKLAENLGASQMIWDAGVTLALCAVEHMTGKTLLGATPQNTRKNLREQPPLSDDPGDVEVLTAASGKAILLVNSEEVGRNLVYAVTTRCLMQLPGVELRGVVGRRQFEVLSADLDCEMRAVHEELAALAGMIPGPEFRFLRLPIVAPCATSNLPASILDRGAPEGPQLRSQVSSCKRSMRPGAWTRFEGALDLENANFRLPKNPGELERLQDRLDWFAVIHADGNSVGAVFQNFGERSGAKGRDYIVKLRNFSLALDECTERAVRVALDTAYERWGPRPGGEPQDKTLPAVPLVLGGDDLTMLCDGHIALRTTHDFLDAFARAAETHEDICVVTQNGGEPITASAGVAIVKPHFPFHLAYELAEELLRSAKRAKPEPAIDFLVHYDASGGDLDEIRKRLIVGDALLYGRPYRMGDGDWAAFAEAVNELNGETSRQNGDQSGEDDPIPRSLLHELRSALFLGRDAAERQLQWALQRRGSGDVRLRNALKTLHGSPNLFEKCPAEMDQVRAKDQPVWRSKLLDALEAQEFWE